MWACVHVCVSPPFSSHLCATTFLMLTMASDPCTPTPPPLPPHTHIRSHRRVYRIIASPPTRATCIRVFRSTSIASPPSSDSTLSKCKHEQYFYPFLRASISGSFYLRLGYGNKSCLTCVKHIPDIRNCVVSLFVSHNYVPVNRGHRSRCPQRKELRRAAPHWLRSSRKGRCFPRTSFVCWRAICTWLDKSFTSLSSHCIEHTEDSERRIAQKDKETSERTSSVTCVRS